MAECSQFCLRALLIEIQEEIHHFAGWEREVKGNENCEQTFCEQTDRKGQGFPKMPFVKCLSGFGHRTRCHSGPSPMPQECPQKKSKEACLVPAPKARLYRKVLVAKYLPGGAEGPYQGQLLSPRKCLKNVLGTRFQGTFGCKARLENAERGNSHSFQAKRPNINDLRGRRLA